MIFYYLGWLEAMFGKFKDKLEDLECHLRVEYNKGYWKCRGKK